MKSCNRSPCSFTACALGSCTLIPSDVKHHPVTGTTHRGREGTPSEMSKAALWPCLVQKLPRCPLQPAGNLIQHKMDFCKTKAKAAPSDAIWQAQEDLFESTRLELIGSPVIKKKNLLNPSRLCKIKREKNVLFPHKNIPHGRYVFSWAFLWVAVHFKTIFSYLKAFKNRERTALILLFNCCEPFHTCIFLIEH